MTGASKKSLFRSAAIMFIGLIAIIVLSISEDAMSLPSATAIKQGSEWADYCSEEANPQRCCENVGSWCVKQCEDLTDTSDGLASCQLGCDDARDVCLGNLQSSRPQAPSFGNPQKAAPLPAPLSPRTPSQAAPRPGVLAPTPAQPLMKSPSKTAPQQLKKAPTVQAVPQVISPSTQPSFGGSNILEGGRHSFSCSAKFCQCKEGTAECIDLGSANLCDKGRPMLCSGGRCICNRK